MSQFSNALAGYHTRETYQNEGQMSTVTQPTTQVEALAEKLHAAEQKMGTLLKSLCDDLVNMNPDKAKAAGMSWCQGDEFNWLFGTLMRQTRGLFSPMLLSTMLRMSVNSKLSPEDRDQRSTKFNKAKSLIRDLADQLTRVEHPDGKINELMSSIRTVLNDPETP